MKMDNLSKNLAETWKRQKIALALRNDAQYSDENSHWVYSRKAQNSLEAVGFAHFQPQKLSFPFSLLFSFSLLARMKEQ